MPGAAELFARFPNPTLLEQGIHDGLFFRRGFADSIVRRFADTPIATAVTNLIEAQGEQPTAFSVNDLLRELHTKTLVDMGRPNSIWFWSDIMGTNIHTSPTNGQDWSWYPYEDAAAVQPMMQAALAVKGLVAATHPDFINSRDRNNPNALGLMLTLLPDIPEGVYIIRATGSETASRRGIDQGRIDYEQLTMVDTRSGQAHEEQLLFLTIADDRTDNGEGFAGEYNRVHHIIAEIAPLAHEQLHYVPGETREGIQPDVVQIFGHLPEGVADIPQPA